MDAVVAALLGQRGVQLTDIAQLTYDLQKGYVPDLTLEEALRSVEAVLAKREVQNAILTGLAIDQLADGGNLPRPLLDMVRSDDPLYGMDEILALAITNVYGSIGLTNFGYLDKLKPGFLTSIHSNAHQVNTFLDDIVAGIAAAAAARLAHHAAGLDPGP